MRHDVAQALYNFQISNEGINRDIENVERLLNEYEQVLFIAPVNGIIVSDNKNSENLMGVAILTSTRFIFHYKATPNELTEEASLDEICFVKFSGTNKKGDYLEIHTSAKTYYILLYFNQKTKQYLQDLFAWAKNNAATNKLVPNQQSMQIQQTYNQPVQGSATISGNFLHFSGLPIAEKAECQLLSYYDHYDFLSGKMKFSLAKSKVMDVSCKTETEFHSQYVSSVGGAVAGAALFGPIGAMVGGRAKKKTNMTTRHYLIVTYMSNNEVKYIVLENTGILNKTNKFVIEFNAIRTASTNIEL